MKRIIAMILALTLCLLLMVGCLGDENEGDGQDTLTVTIPYGRNDEIVEALKAEFPDISFKFNRVITDNASSYLSQKNRHGDSDDLIWYSAFTTMKADTDQYLDLSGQSFIGNIKGDIVELLDVDGHIYQIPGPLELRCIVYNKTIFEQNGWTIPTSFDEMIEVIGQIRADQPQLIPLAYPMLPGYSFVLPATFAQAGYLSTPAGYKWEQDWFAGEASYAVGLDEGFTAVERLVQAGAFQQADRFVGKGNCNAELVSGEVAMGILWGGVNGFFDAASAADCEYEYGLLPFYGLDEGDSVIGYNASSMWSINKSLSEKGNEKKLANALMVMEWLVSAEGQEILRGNRGQIPVTKDGAELDPRIAELLERSSNGYSAPGLYTGYEHMIVDAGQIIQDAIVAGDTATMRDDAVSAADRLNAEFTANNGIAGFAHLSADINEAETAQLMANILYSTGKGDFALITHTEERNGFATITGASGMLYAGGITNESLLTINAKRKYFVTTVEMTGAEVRQLLEQGKGMYLGEDKAVSGKAEYASDADSLPQEYFQYYWSGLDVTLNNGKLQSVSLNGQPLSDTATYTVVFGEKDYPRAYNDRALVSNTLVSDAMLSYFETHKEIAPPEVLRK